uniref:Uncharacterized protein n=1 Tax=Oryza barthii TaxID=65489 RepID=A0A0D3H5F9_9ORYZ
MARVTMFQKQGMRCGGEAVPVTSWRRGGVSRQFGDDEECRGGSGMASAAGTVATGNCGHDVGEREA